jgi:hypothetical protein
MRIRLERVSRRKKPAKTTSLEDPSHRRGSGRDPCLPCRAACHACRLTADRKGRPAGRPGAGSSRPSPVARRLSAPPLNKVSRTTHLLYSQAVNPATLCHGLWHGHLACVLWHGRLARVCARQRASRDAGVRLSFVVCRLSPVALLYPPLNKVSRDAYLLAEQEVKPATLCHGSGHTADCAAGFLPAGLRSLHFPCFPSRWAEYPLLPGRVGNSRPGPKIIGRLHLQLSKNSAGRTKARN